MIRYALPRSTPSEVRARVQRALDDAIQPDGDSRFVGRGQIDSASLDKIVLLNLEDLVSLDPDCNVLEELSRDLEYLHPRRK